MTQSVGALSSYLNSALQLNPQAGGQSRARSAGQDLASNNSAYLSISATGRSLAGKGSDTPQTEASDPLGIARGRSAANGALEPYRQNGKVFNQSIERMAASQPPQPRPAEVKPDRDTDTDKSIISRTRPEPPKRPFELLNSGIEDHKESKSASFPKISTAFAKPSEEERRTQASANEISNARTAQDSALRTYSRVAGFGSENSVSQGNSFARIA